MHKRRAIREAVESELNNISGLTVKSARVYALDGLPACVILQDSESNNILHIDSSDFDIMRTLTLKLELIVAASTDVDDVLDGLCESVELQLSSNRKLGGLAFESMLTLTEIEFEGEGEKPHGKATLTYEYQYITPVNNPSA